VDSGDEGEFLIMRRTRRRRRRRRGRRRRCDSPNKGFIY